MSIGTLKTLNISLEIQKAMHLGVYSYMPSTVCVLCSGMSQEHMLLPLSTLEVLIKKEVKAKAWLKTAWQSVKSLAQQVHRSPHKGWETYWFQAHKETSVQSLPDHY